MKSPLCFASVLLLSATLMATPTLAGSPNPVDLPAPIAWKFAHPAPPASLLPPIWQSGFDWLHDASNGAITIKQYGGGTLYGVSGGLNALRAGVADFGTCYSNEEARGFELVKTLQLPFAVPAQPWLRAAIVSTLASTKLQQEYQARGVYLAHILPTAPLKILSKSPIHTPEDLRGKKVFSPLNAPGAAKALGYTEVRIPFPELYSSLQLGLIDTVIWVDMGIIPYKLYEQAHFYTDMSIAMTTVETCFSRRSFDSLPTPLKPLMREAQQRIVVEMVQKSVDFSTQAHNVLKTNGVEVLSLNDTERNAWETAYAPMREQWFRQCSEAGKDCRALLNEVQALAQRYGALDDNALRNQILSTNLPQ